MVACGSVLEGTSVRHLDELSTLGPSVVAEFYQPHGLATSTISPALFPLQPATLADLRGGDAQTNATIVQRVLAGEERGPKRDIVLLNAAAALFVADLARSLIEGWELAARIMDSGQASRKLEGIEGRAGVRAGRASSCRALALLEAFHGGALELALGLAALEVFAFVELGFALAHREGHFDLAVLPVEGQREQGVAFDGRQAEELADFGFVQQEFAGGLGLVVEAVAAGVFVNVGVVKIDLVVFHAGKGVADLALAGAQGFDLGAVQDDAGLEGFEDVVIAPGFGVGKDVGHNRRRETKGAGRAPAREGPRPARPGQTAGLVLACRFLPTGRANSTTSGISKPIFSSMISRRATSAAPRLPASATRGRLMAPAARIKLADAA